MIDEPDDVLDYQVASHIVSVHQKKDQAFTAPYTMTQIQRYIKFARSLKPQMTPEVFPPLEPFPCPLNMIFTLLTLPFLPAASPPNKSCFSHMHGIYPTHFAIKAAKLVFNRIPAGRSYLASCHQECQRRIHKGRASLAAASDICESV